MVLGFSRPPYIPTDLGGVFLDLMFMELLLVERLVYQLAIQSRSQFGANKITTTIHFLIELVICPNQSNCNSIDRSIVHIKHDQ